MDPRLGGSEGGAFGGALGVALGAALGSDLGGALGSVLMFPQRERLLVVKTTQKHRLDLGHGGSRSWAHKAMQFFAFRRRAFICFMEVYFADRGDSSFCPPYEMAHKTVYH